MTSQLNVDTIFGSDGSKPAALAKQQTAKAWSVIDADATTAISLDSFNESTTEDGGAGKYGINLTNYMSHANYHQVTSQCYSTTTASYQRYIAGAYSGGAIDRDKTTSNAKIGYYNSSYVDTFITATLITGDLA